MRAFDVVVVGSLNRDTVLHVQTLPNPGETVFSDRRTEHLGGKGANQAVAAARAGARVAMVGRVGDDPAGRQLVEALASEGVDVQHIGVEPDIPTGEAVIGLEASGENSIFVHAGANAALSPDHVAAATEAIGAASVVLAQLEVPVVTVEAAATLARRLFVLNPAPATVLPRALLAQVDVLVPNETELRTLAGGATADVATLAASLEGPDCVVVTLGARGALVRAAGAQPQAIPAPATQPVNAVGAGDCFCGYLAASLAAGSDIEAAVGRAVRAASLSTTREGSGSSSPHAHELDDGETRTVPC